MPKTASDRVALRGRVFYYVRRVPRRFEQVDKRGIVFVSLHTEDRRQAEEAAITAERELEALWVSLAAQGDPDAWKRYQAAMERARLEGFAYRSPIQIRDEHVSSIVDRMRSLAGREDDRSAAAAIAGLEPKPEIPISKAMELYFGFSAGELLGKRDDQVRRWKNPRNLALSEFQQCIGGDLEITALTREHARMFRDMWLKRIREGGYGRNSMNKQISHMSRMLHVVSEEMKLGLDPIFAKLSVSEKKRSRPPFDRKWVEEKILAVGALDGLNLEARVALLVCMETGMGAEEVSSLRPATIHLKAPVPYVSVVSREGAEQKTEYRPRDIPLVGIALKAMKLCPAGVTRYYDKNASLSGVINKFLRENHLLQSEDHSLYSFRHSFQDRLTDAEAPDRVQADLMGHKYVREKYGKGASLTQKARWLSQIAYKAPAGWKV
ncbi:DUF6538 domain-containing protein [Bosea massiliensis]|uniref:DUF6538 domain-containing protein n=1 Tax=Bosea massiliensis TaxID=151419 RepID=A0ABW0PA29_9HYPH